MSADKLVFDLSQEIEGSPQVFIKKDWLSILDNMNANYSSNQTIIDTSQLSNSNKYMSYREAYLAVPLTMTLTTGTTFVQPVVTGGVVAPAGMNGSVGSAAVTGGIAGFGAIYPRNADYAMGLKNWFGTLFHSLTLDMNGTTIIQQTPLINMVNSFRLMTTLSWNDVITQGATIGFYPDSPCSWTVTNSTAGAIAPSTAGIGVCNNTIYPATEQPYQADSVAGVTTWLNGNPTSQLASDAGTGNKGLLKRIQNLIFDFDAPAGFRGASTINVERGGTTVPFSALTNGGTSAFTTLWEGYIYQKANGIQQIATMATVYLKHLHNFFAMAPLLKGTFFKLTCFLNNATTVFTVAGKTYDATTAATIGTSALGLITLNSVSVAVGGVNPLMITETSYAYGGAYALGDAQYTASVAVGANVIANHTVPAGAVLKNPLGQSIYLYIPSYTFNPVFENAYLSSPVKSIKYSDYYQYQVVNVAGGGSFNNLLTNGIANIKSVLLIPFYSSSASTSTACQASGLLTGLPAYQSPFDPAGTGSTSPLCMFSSFNVVISGQNAIYNTERYSWEHFNNQMKGCNAVNGDQTDGLTSGLIDRKGWLSSQCYWYVNVSRMLPVEESVPKSVQIVGINQSAFPIDIICFIEYGVSVDIDALTGARV